MVKKSNYPAIMSILKQKLKQNKITVKTLSHTLEVPESTLKKWFMAKDGSYNRIASISEALGIPVHAVLKELEDQNLKTFSFSKEQQVAFSKDFPAFKVYWLLVYERLSSKEIPGLLSLKESEYKKILFKLDALRLIQIGSYDKVRVPKMRPVTWAFEGVFMESLKRDWTQRLIEDSRREVLQFFQLTPDSEQELLKDLKQLEEKYARRTILELSGHTKIKQIRYFNGCAEGSFVI